MTAVAAPKRPASFEGLERLHDTWRDAEKTVIGGLLFNPEILPELDCSADDFQNIAYRRMFRALSIVSARGKPVDAFLVLRAANLLDETYDRYWFQDIVRTASESQAKADAPLLRECRVRHEATLAVAHPDFFNVFKPRPSILKSLGAQTGSSPNANDRSDFWQDRGYAPPIGVKAFLEHDFKVEYLVDRCLAKKAACIIAGASKAMKTTVSLYLSMCLAAGKPFFGRFYTQKTRVMFASAESGAAVLQRNLRGMADLMGLDLAELCEDGYLSLQFWVPKVANEDMLGYFGDCIDSVKPGVVVLDPLYLALDGDTQANLSLNGEQIHTLVQAILDRGCTPVVDDHVKRSSGNAKEYKSLQLEDITGAGKSEYFRQWMLLGRRSRFDDTEDSNTRNHDLWLTIGGSAGHSATWGLDIGETFDERFETVSYSMDLRPASDIREEAKTEQSATKEAKAEIKAKAAAERIQRKADEIVSNIFAGDMTLALTANDIKGRLGISGNDFPRILQAAIDSKRIKLVTGSVVRANKQKYDGYMLEGALGVTNQWDPNHEK